MSIARYSIRSLNEVINLNDNDETIFTSPTNEKEKSQVAKQIIHPVVRETFTDGKPDYFDQYKHIDLLD